MEKLPVEWIAKIFNYLDDFFKEEWRQLYTEDRINISIRQWQSGLLGVTADEIKKGLAICKCMAKNAQKPPNVIEFYYYSKGLKLPPSPPKKSAYSMNRELAANSIAELKKLSRGYA